MVLVASELDACCQSSLVPDVGVHRGDAHVASLVLLQHTCRLKLTGLWPGLLRLLPRAEWMEQINVGGCCLLSIIHYLGVAEHNELVLVYRLRVLGLAVIRLLVALYTLSMHTSILHVSGHQQPRPACDSAPVIAVIGLPRMLGVVVGQGRGVADGLLQTWLQTLLGGHVLGPGSLGGGTTVRGHVGKLLDVLSALVGLDAIYASVTQAKTWIPSPVTCWHSHHPVLGQV